MPTGSDLALSIVVPTYEEVENLPHLVPRIHEVCVEAGITYEVIVVDDNSDDGTIEAVDKLKKQNNVRLLVRTEDRGLSSAVIHGFRNALGDYLMVMDADLSHPPDRIPALLERLEEVDTDVVVGSRYVDGGSIESGWGPFRWLNSKVATWMARPLTRVSDPMAGFFGLSRENFMEIKDLNPLGYKIGLELIVKGNFDRVAEVPICFRDRQYGESKMSLRERLNYVKHLKRLYDYRFKGLFRVFQCVLVGASGFFVDLLAFFVARLLMWLPLARGVAIFVAMTWNFVLNYLITFRQQSDKNAGRLYREFCIACLLGGVLNWGTSLLVINYLGDTRNLHRAIAVFAGVLAGTGVNFFLSNSVVFSKGPAKDE